MTERGTFFVHVICRTGLLTRSNIKKSDKLMFGVGDPIIIGFPVHSLLVVKLTPHTLPKCCSAVSSDLTPSEIYCIVETLAKRMYSPLGECSIFVGKPLNFYRKTTQFLSENRIIITS